MFKKCLIAAAAFAAVAAFATEAEHKPTAQQLRFAECAHESKGLKGDERHRFLSDCMKAHGSGADAHAKSVATNEDAAAPHERLKSCNAEAAKKELHGDDRRAFMSACLKS
jgi:hypothetical protein